MEKNDYSPYQIDKAENSFISFLEWIKQHKITPILVEQPLVSNIDKYGGTLDLYAKIDDKYIIADFKSGKAVYKEHAYQLAALKNLLEQAGHQVDEGWIVRIGTSEDEGFEVRVYKELDKQWEIFKHLLGVYYLEKELK